MALFKCKMCGGDLEILDGGSIAECEYCGTKQTVPSDMNENMQNLFNRANTLRIKSEFDKAEKLYEKIIQSDTTQSEAYWGLILCKYGIEYVDDPVTFKKIPTCHRASYDSVIADEDYKSALENADFAQRALYEEQAKEIDRIQKDIVALAQKQETYDVFICYKETDANGQRTHDSVIANDIYYQLTQEGFKVFYAAITLEGKLGNAYEPIIFAALNSSKVMLAIGTKPEYFNAVWVKNEWSRFLKVMKNDRSKMLIPCYRDMDAYELPDEFAHLQSQNMAKIGFINDVVRGIKKVIVKNEHNAVKGTVITDSVSNFSTLLKRAFMFLEYGDWKSADEYAERVLDQEPECADAYLCKLMAELKVTKKENLKNCEKPFDQDGNYQITLRFADDTLKDFLTDAINHIKLRNEQEYIEQLYNAALIKMENANNENAYLLAARLFRDIITYKNSNELADECTKKAEEARQKGEKEKQKCIEIAKIGNKINIVFILLWLSGAFAGLGLLNAKYLTHDGFAPVFTVISNLIICGILLLLYSFNNKYRVLKIDAREQSDFKNIKVKHNFILLLVAFIEICTIVIFLCDKWIITVSDLYVIPYLCIIAFVANLVMMAIYLVRIYDKKNMVIAVRVTVIAVALGISIWMIYEFCNDMESYKYMREIQQLFSKLA